jgi:hypothetical protein
MTVGELRAALADPMLEDRHEVVGIFPDYAEGCLCCGGPDVVIAGRDGRESIIRDALRPEGEEA